MSLANLAECESALGRIDEALALARQWSAAELRISYKILSFTSEQRRLAYLDTFEPYGLFPFLKGTETDLATAVLRYRGIVLDSIVEDRLLAEAGSDKTQLLSVQIYISDLVHFAAMNAAWDMWVPEGNAPPRATVEAKLANPACLVEVVVVAAVRSEAGN